MQPKHTHKKICAVYEEGSVTDWRCQKWFAEFCAGDFSLDHAPQTGIPVEVDGKQIETLIENNQCYYYVRDSWHAQNIQQALNIICTSLVMFITLMFEFHII